MEAGKKTYYRTYAVLSVLISIFIIFVNDRIRSGFFMKLVGVVVSSGAGFIGFLLGDFLRKLALPDMIFTTGGFFSLLRQRLFWMCGPQLIGIVLGSMIAASQVLDISHHSLRTQQQAVSVAPTAATSTPGSKPFRNEPVKIPDDIEAQVAMFLEPPSPERTVGEWTLIGPVQGRYETYFRAITNDCLETNTRMGCDLLLLDYSANRPDTPTICIAVAVLSSLEEVMPSYSGIQMYNILVDGGKVGRIRFNARPSPMHDYVLLEQVECASIANVHSQILRGKRVSFVGDTGEQFDFDINGLASIERRL